MLVTFDANTKSRPNSNDPPSSTTSKSILNNPSNSNQQHTTSPNNGVIQNVIVNQGTDLKEFKFTKRRTNYACITCKIRRKKCSEERPICSDCKRLGKSCVWATDDMSIETIRALKKKVEEEENLSKGKRKAALALQSEAKKKSKKPAKQITKPVPVQTQPTTSNPEKDNSNTKINNLLNSDIFQRHDDLLQRSQTPIASNLLNITSSRQNSVQPQFPEEENSTTPNDHNQQLWQMTPHDNLFEFSSFFESNLRQNSKKISSKIVQLDENGKEIDNGDDEDSQSDVLALNGQHDFHDLALLIPEPSPVNLENLYPFNFNILQNQLPNTLDLDPIGSYLYNYYINRLSGIVSIVPAESNYYLKSFIPMAAQNPGILNSILAWSAYHLGPDYAEEGTMYMSRSLEYLQKTNATTDSEILQKLANLLIIAAAEICKGDVRKWPAFLEWGAKIIKQRGGLYNFKKDTEQRWLISNFAYHDILTSSSSERGTYFPVEDYENFLVNLGPGIDPLQGIVKPLFNIIGEISSLAFETKRLLKISSTSLGYGILDEEHGTQYNGQEGNEDDDDDDDDDDDGNGNNDLFEIPGIDTPESEKGKKVSRYTSLLTIMSKSSELENKINDVKPNPEDLINFSAHDLELQLTLFELFQLTAKLHLRQSVLRLNPSSLETQFILCELLKCLDIVLKSSVEGSLCFPLFIAGMNCTTKKDRKLMLERFTDIIQRYSFKNLERARTVMEQVWMIDPSGTRCVDWYEIVKKLNWDLSFA